MEINASSRYLDLVGELTAGLYGHSHPVIREAIINTLDNVGLNLGANTTQEQKHAALICQRFNLDRVRFTNSGTEANLHALNAAKAFVGGGKSKVIVFNWGYHGAVLMFGHGQPAPNNVNKGDWVIGRYNNVESTKRLIEETEGLAAVLVEPMQGAGGCIPGTREFLFQIQESAKKVGAVFILDEVMTSRLAPGGLQSVLGLKPDITSFGKYLGGGAAFGGFGGRADIMAVYDPRSSGSLIHSGTFNNNTLAMHAGYAGLSKVYTPEVAVAFNKKGEQLRNQLQKAGKGTKFTFTGVGSLTQVHVTDSGMEDISCADDVVERQDIRDLFWFEMLEQGYWLHRRGSINLMLGIPDEELERFVECFKEFLEKYKSIVSL